MNWMTRWRRSFRQQSDVGGCLEIRVRLRQHVGARRTRQSCQAPLAMANFTLLPSKPSFTADVPRSLRVQRSSTFTTSPLDVATFQRSALQF